MIERARKVTTRRDPMRGTLSLRIRVCDRVKLFDTNVHDLESDPRCLARHMDRRPPPAQAGFRRQRNAVTIERLAIGAVVHADTVARDVSERLAYPEPVAD